jgi:hypothetical protein
MIIGVDPPLIALSLVVEKTTGETPASIFGAVESNFIEKNPCEIPTLDAICLNEGV